MIFVVIILIYHHKAFTMQQRNAESIYQEFNSNNGTIIKCKFFLFSVKSLFLDYQFSTSVCLRKKGGPMSS